MNTMLEPRIVAARVHRRCALPHCVVGALRVVTTASSHGGLTRFIYASSLTQPWETEKENAAHFRERRSRLYEVECWIRSLPPPHAGCPRGDAGPLPVLTLSI